MSGIINKVKDALHSDKAHEQPEGTHGPHSGRVANAADPRIDSDRDGRANPATGTSSTHTGGISSTGTHSTGLHSTGSHNTEGLHSTGTHNTEGLHSTGTHNAGGLHSTGTHNAGGLHSTGTHNAGGLHSTGTHNAGGLHSTGTHNAGGLHSTGTHNAGGLHSTGGHVGAQTTGYNDPAGTHGPHGSKVSNIADPRIDSDRDHRAAPGAAGTSHIGSGPGPASNTAGPHKSDMLNKADPRVDSDLDGSKTVGGNKTYQQTGNSSLAHKDPTDAAQVPPSVLRQHVGDPDVLHNDPHHGHDQRHGSMSHQEAHVVGKTV